MAAPAHAWSPTRQQQLAEQLPGFCQPDEWDMNACPFVPAGSTAFYALSFVDIAPTLKLELKYACWQKFERGEWQITKRATANQRCRLRLIQAWLQHIGAQDRSFLQRSLPAWELSLRSYLAVHTTLPMGSVVYLDRQQHPRHYPQANGYLAAFRQIYKLLEATYDTRTEYDKDVWNPLNLGLADNPTRSPLKFNFTPISQPWLRQAVKQWMRYSLALYSVADCYKKLDSLKVFGSFLVQHDPALRPEQLDRAVIVCYIAFLATSGVSVKLRVDRISHLRGFLEACVREGWAPIPDKRLVYDNDAPRKPKPQPRAMPQEVVDQLNQHLDALPSDVKHMVLILQECGMRINELCALRIDCLTQDAEGDWFLHCYQRKMQKDHSIPISREVAQVIRDQQRHVRATWGEQTPWLFPQTATKPWQQYSFGRALNQLGYEHQIRDAMGNLWRFQAHQFRHYVGTKMINSGVPQHIVQRYLGHESPDMTSVYAQIHDQTMKAAFAEYRGKTVDVTGRVIEAVEDGVNAADLQWVKKNIQAQLLPNGRCSLPAAASACPHANACLTCAHFRTDAGFLPVHQAQLAETRRVIEMAQANGWTRMVEMNARVATNLERIIIALEPTT